MAVTESGRLTLVLRYADLGIATYASLQIVGQPERTVAWVVEEPLLLAALQELAAALPEPHDAENRRAAIGRALSTGAFAAPDTELTLAYILGVLLIGSAGWQLLTECVSSPRAVLFVSPSARLARVPWGLLAIPKSGPSKEELVRARQDAITAAGRAAAQIPWRLGDLAALTDGHRLMELVEVLMAVPPNIVHAPRTATEWDARRDGPPLLVLDPRVPGQRPDSALGSVLGRPSPDTPVGRHFAELMRRRPVLPRVDAVVDLFRRRDADRRWLAGLLARSPCRLLYVGHASSADDDHRHGGRADRAALHLADPAAVPGDANAIGDHRPLTASDLMALRLPMPPRVALLACGSGGDYQFDEATGLVAAMILNGAQLVTATLWSLPTTAAYRQFAMPARGSPESVDPMADLVSAVDTAHDAPADAGCALNRWQRAQMRRWRDGDRVASPLYWAALATFTVDGAR
ncbi:CHAT domain-containing protein [Mycobacterium avium subsp. hominissuis]|uniref:CHAT domain-containing protein n=1 Tax=Mycobacterium avium TaxID=1764 RepID=UPI000AFB4183|nr:CHAT domain-containing protein [Mycobacterium avium]APA74145.2 CHAT domain-containing protein [Mycobacterium avium subsp. hominissuis]MCA2334694.1 CHAT domain-containing protein [Mycobacterium avium]MCA4732527.1 CHAT domain-containing protein [Mycobacterium avium subsp. hominissuis]MCA4737940.1 CHAT domain-containing protein [Mycobacterium avium subsp. hominissuis]MCA4742321.1 CHAT domain-containing protein [Mycobacterium avium subsp. hominissuis]